MNREIKFRAWDKKEKKWIKPDPCGEVCVGGGIVTITNF